MFDVIWVMDHRQNNATLSGKQSYLSTCSMLPSYIYIYIYIGET